ncbi:DNA ligase [compost metagenome]
MGLFDIPPPVGLKPNLAGKFDAEKQKFPCYGSPKIDGIRALGVHTTLLSRSLKLIPNSFTQERFNNCHGRDGELVVGKPNHPNVMQATSSGVMSRKGEPDVYFYIFDRWDMGKVSYEDRLQQLFVGNPYVVILNQVLLHNQQELDDFEAECIAAGYEGVMTRDPKGKYKNGRSTANEGGLIKVKRYSHGEARITGFEELMYNENEEFYNELGNITRSSHQENLVPSGTLGAYWVEHPYFDRPFKISAASMTHPQRKWAWDNRDATLGCITRFKWFNHGVKHVPRHGIWAGYRELADLDPTHPLWVDEVIEKITLLFPLE